MLVKKNYRLVPVPIPKADIPNAFLAVSSGITKR
jgi:hypothetical protein